MQKHEKKYCFKNFKPPPNYNVEETSKFKGLHYVNQWYDNQKSFKTYEGVLQDTFSCNYVFLENMLEIMGKPLFFCKGLLAVTTLASAQILTHYHFA